MLKLSKLTDYATVILSQIGKDATKLHSAWDIAEITGITQPTVSKVLKALQKEGLLKSVRGAKGGYTLAKPAKKISIASIIIAMEGPIALTECSESHRSCDQAKGCHIQGNWHLINQKILYALESVTLSDLIAPPRRPEEVVIPITSLYR